MGKKPPSSGTLRVAVRQAEDLLGVDKSGTSDPFCLLTLQDEFNLPLGKPQKTRAKKKNLNPSWKEEFTWALPKRAVGV